MGLLFLHVDIVYRWCSHTHLSLLSSPSALTASCRECTWSDWAALVSARVVFPSPLVVVGLEIASVRRSEIFGELSARTQAFISFSLSICRASCVCFCSFADENDCAGSWTVASESSQQAHTHAARDLPQGADHNGSASCKRCRCIVCSVSLAVSERRQTLVTSLSTSLPGFTVVRAFPTTFVGVFVTHVSRAWRSAVGNCQHAVGERSANKVRVRPGRFGLSAGGHWQLDLIVSVV